jgi:hypothetical protein
MPCAHSEDVRLEILGVSEVFAEEHAESTLRAARAAVLAHDRSLWSPLLRVVFRWPEPVLDCTPVGQRRDPELAGGCVSIDLRI